MNRPPWNSDDEGGASRFVPLYVLLNGRTTPRNTGLDLATQVIAQSGDARALEPEYEAIVNRCWDWMSVAEIAAYLNYPLAVTKLLVDVLLERRFLAVGSPAQEPVVDYGILETILARLESL